MSRRHFFGAKGDHEQNVAALLRAAPLPLAEQIQGQFVSPLAIIEQDQGGPILTPQGFQQGDQ
jgi:hypothetical protein